MCVQTLGNFQDFIGHICCTCGIYYTVFFCVCVCVCVCFSHYATLGVFVGSYATQAQSHQGSTICQDTRHEGPGSGPLPPGRTAGLSAAGRWSGSLAGCPADIQGVISGKALSFLHAQELL